MNQHRLVIDADGTLANVGSNAELLKLIDQAPTLNPRELLQMAGRISRIGTQQDLADYLARTAFRKIATHKPIIDAVSKIKNVEVGWSFFGDVWDAIVDFFGGEPAGGGETREGSGSTAGRSGCDIKCVVPSFIGAGMMVEKCPKDRSWRVIGICVGSTF